MDEAMVLMVGHGWAHAAAYRPSQDERRLYKVSTTQNNRWRRYLAEADPDIYG
jgi:hypothetical protein